MDGRGGRFRLLHQKIDALREQELADLARAVRDLSQLLEARRA